MDLHIDIILIIINLLSIPDIRNLIRCDRKLNLLHSKNKLLSVDINSLNWENKLNSDLSNPKIYIYVNLYDINLKDLSKKDKYIIEINYNGYCHLLLNRYIYINNYTSISYGRIQFNAEYNNFLELIKFNTKFINGYRFTIARGATVAGNLKILKWLKQQRYQFASCEWIIAVKCQHFIICNC